MPYSHHPGNGTGWPSAGLPKLAVTDTIPPGNRADAIKDRLVETEHRQAWSVEERFSESTTPERQ